MLFKINKKLEKLSKEAEHICEDHFNEIDSTTEYCQQKMLKAFIDCGVSESHFGTSTGYGYADRGRETLDKVYAKAFCAESALVRHNFVSGTHALTVALFGVLRPNDKMLCVTGTPYDTIRGVIGINENKCGSLKDFMIDYEQIDLKEDGSIDFDAIKNYCFDKVKVVYLQRSKGYALRTSLLTKDIERIVNVVKSKSKSCVIMVDNCYGEFVEKNEPTFYGADLIIGSLIKNPGGGISSTGGYIAGKKHLVEMCSYRLTTPGTGSKIGATLGKNRELFMGAFHAPNVTGQALKTAVFTAALFEKLGYETFPKYNEKRADIVQTVILKSEAALIEFCRGIQSGSPVDSFVTLEPWDMPGYDNKIIMASGSFTLGSSIEISADAPLKKPYAAFIQGGLNFFSSKACVMLAVEHMYQKGIISI